MGRNKRTTKAQTRRSARPAFLPHTRDARIVEHKTCESFKGYVLLHRAHHRSRAPCSKVFSTPTATCGEVDHLTPNGVRTRRGVGHVLSSLKKPFARTVASSCHR